MNRLSVLSGLAGVSMLVAPLGVRAAEPSASPRFYARLGVAHFDFRENAKIQLGGAPVPGGNATVDNNTPLSVELGYFLTPHISLAATIGVPPTTTLRGAGSLQGAGALGTVTYGPGVYTVRYHFNPEGKLRPYVGAGVNWTIVFDTDDRALQNFKTSNTFGPTVTAGVVAPVSDRFSLFGSVSKGWIKTDSTYDLATPGGLVPGKRCGGR